MLLKDVRAHPNIVRQEDGIECFRHWSFNIPKNGWSFHVISSFVDFYLLLFMGMFHGYVSSQRRQATGHETAFFLFFAFFRVLGGDVKVPVNLLTSCMLRELRGLGGVGRGGMLKSLWTCSRHVCFVNFGVWVGWGGGGMLTSLWTCSRHVFFVNFGVDIYIYIYTEYDTMKNTFWYIYICIYV